MLFIYNVNKDEFVPPSPVPCDSDKIYSKPVCVVPYLTELKGSYLLLDTFLSHWFIPAVRHTCKTFSKTLFKTSHTTSGTLYQEDSNMKTHLYCRFPPMLFLLLYCGFSTCTYVLDVVSLLIY